MTTHKIEAGDWLGALADAYGLEHWSKIWDDAVNASLRELRASPDLVMVGDEVQIPSSGSERGIEVATGNRAVFVVRGPDALRLRICGVGSFIAAFGPIAFKLEVGSQVIEGNLEEEGQELNVVLEATAKQGKLTLMEKTVHEFSIGGLGPAHEERGAHARLINLGFGGDFEPGGEAGEDSPAEASEPVKTAISTFQARNALDVTGTLDARTVSAIQSKYEGDRRQA